MLNASTDATTSNYGARTEGVWRFKNGKLYSGFDYRVEAADGTRAREFLMGSNAGNTIYDNVWQEGQISKTGWFGEYHLNVSKIHFIFSGRMELNNAVINNPSDIFININPDTEITQFNPSVSIGANKKC